MAASKQTGIHTHVRNAVTLVWGSLRLAPIMSTWMFWVPWIPVDTTCSNYEFAVQKVLCQLTGLRQLVHPSTITPLSRNCYKGGLKQLAACKPECNGGPPWLWPVITPLQWGNVGKGFRVTPRLRLFSLHCGGILCFHWRNGRGITSEPNIIMG